MKQEKCVAMGREHLSFHTLISIVNVQKESI